MITLNQLLSQTNSVQTTFYQLFQQYGFLNFVLPFLLIFSLTFMLLELSNLLKTSPDDDVGRKLNALFSLGFTLLAIYNQNLVKWLLLFIPKAGLAIIAFALMVIVLALTNKKIPSWLRAFFAFIVVGIILWLAVNSLSIAGPASSPLVGLLSYTLDYLIQSGTLQLLIIFAFIFLVIALLIGGEKKEEREERIRGPIILRSR